MSIALQLMWAVTGLFLTIGSTFLKPSIIIPFWSGQDSVVVQQVSVTMQIGAVLLTGCLGGRNAAVLSQVVYIVLGLSGFGVFYQGGGLSYLQSPAFGYLLGFIPGAGICGTLAFRQPSSIERLAVSCLAGLATIHAVGIIYLTLVSLPKFNTIGTALMQYSLQVLPGQLVVVCAAAVLAASIRRVLFY